MSFISLVAGQMLKSNLDRAGIDLTISNANVGINVLNPGSALEVAGNVKVGNTVISNVTGNINLSTAYINNLSNPVQAQDAATKDYVDNLAGNVSFTISDGANTQAVISGDTITFAGTANQVTAVVGATDTVTFGLTNTIAVDGVTSLTTNGNLTISANGTGNVVVNKTMFTGNVNSGNIVVGNILIPSTGNVNLGNVAIANLATPTQSQDAVNKQYVDSLIGNGVSNIGNLTVTDTTISSVTANANIVIDPNGTGTFVVIGTNGIVLPSGNVAQRPSPAATGTLRFNSEYGRIEYYDGVEWDVVAGGITNQTISSADGLTTVFTLNRDATTASILVMLNGVVQLPTTAYSVAGNALTFTQAPQVSDIIDIRFL